MKFLIAAASLVALAGCSTFDGKEGNPNGMAYAGQPGSYYDPAVNPPSQVGTVAYDANAPTKMPDDVIPAPLADPKPAR